MKVRCAMMLCVVFLVMASGCTTVDDAAVDERNVGTIAGDKKIVTIILKRFLEDDIVKVLDISPECYYGRVYLVGEYDTSSQKKQAIKIAKGVTGVRSVTTHLLPKKNNDSCGTTDNLEITAKIKMLLIKDADIWSTNVQVKTVQCNVVLLGIVESNVEILKAIAYAKAVAGVRSVTSFIKTPQ